MHLDKPCSSYYLTGDCRECLLLPLQQLLQPRLSKVKHGIELRTIER